MEFDKAIRDGYPHATRQGHELRGQYFCTGSSRPLNEVDLDPPLHGKRHLRLVSTSPIEEGDPDGCSPWSCRSGTPATNLDRAPEELQKRLFELTQLRINAHYETQEATVVITLPKEELAMVSATASALGQPDQPAQSGQRATKLQVKGSVNAACAPGAARTASTRNRTRRELLVSATVEVVRRRRRSGGGAR